VGTPLPANPEGVASANCWGPGKPFGDYGTPQIVTLHFTDWIEANLFQESYRKELDTPKQLYQTVDPLIWIAESSLWKWELRYLEFTTYAVLLLKPIPILAFRSIAAPLCAEKISNTLNTPEVVIATGGFMRITFSEVFT